MFVIAKDYIFKGYRGLISGICRMYLICCNLFFLFTDIFCCFPDTCRFPFALSASFTSRLKNSLIL